MRTLLSTISASMITVAAFTFSITIVALSTASQQFGPRLLRDFFRDRGYQLVLGTFLAAFVYCLLVLRTVRSNGGDVFVPYISLAVGIVFAFASVCVLVYFIHHAAFSIRAESVVAGSGRELRAAIDRLFPQTATDNSSSRVLGRSLPKGLPSEAREVAAKAGGYIQAINHEQLLRLAHDHGFVLRLDHRVGHFLIAVQRLVDIWPGAAPSEELETKLNGSVVLGTQRSLQPYVESAVDQLVEIATRSLSPGINDPNTAIACIDQLADGLGLIGGRAIGGKSVANAI